MNLKFGIVLGFSVLTSSFVSQANASCEDHYLLSQKNFCVQRWLSKYDQRMEDLEKKLRHPALKQRTKEMLEAPLMIYTAAQKDLADQLAKLKENEKCSKPVEEERNSKCEVQGQVYFDRESRSKKVRDIVIRFESDPKLEEVAINSGNLKKVIETGFGIKEESFKSTEQNLKGLEESGSFSAHQPVGVVIAE